MEKDSAEQCFCLRRQYSRLTADLSPKCLGVCRGKDVTIFNLIMQALKEQGFIWVWGHISLNCQKCDLFSGKQFKQVRTSLRRQVGGIA